MFKASADQGTSTRCIRLVIADRQPIVLQGLISVFAAQHDFEIVASCNDGTSCLEAIRNFAPDVALVADTLPRLTVSEILGIAKAESLPTRLVFFTESESDGNLTAAIAAGACSAISKSANPDTMLRSLRLMTERIASPEQSQYLSPNGKEADGTKIEKMLGLLTHRERQIVRLVSDGMSNKEIARQLNVSHGTVKVHLHNIFQKLEINNRTVLATIALLQRQAGFGALALAALAFAIADDLKASDANDTFLGDDSTTYNADADHEHPEFKLKRAILRHIVDSGETVLLPQRGSPAEASQAASSKARVESLHAAEKTVTSILGRSYGPIGSSTPPLSISPLLQAINNSQIGSPMAQQQFPPLPFVSNPMKGSGGYGIFTMLAGALIYTLDNSHAAVQSPGSGETLVDTSTVVTRDGTTKVATIPGHREFTSWTDKINLAAFGALAFLHMTSASQSVPPHTLAWIYNPASNETIVYVNPTDRSLDVGDAGLLEIHLQGDVSVAESEPAAVAVALEGTDAALLVATADDWTVPTTDSVHASIEAEANESTLGAADVWSLPADDGLRFHFGRDRIGSNVSARLTSFGHDSAYATEASDSAASVSAHVSSIGLAHSNATVPAEQNLTFHANNGALSTGPLSTGQGKAHATAGLDPFEFGMQSAAIAAPVAVAKIVDTAVAPGNSAGNGNSQHASESASAKAAATKLADPGVAPGNSAGHSNSQHASEPASATAATKLAETSVAPGNSAGHGNSQHASESASATAATELAEPGIAPGNSAGHSNSQHASEPASATATTELTETSVAPGNSAGHGNSQHASESASATAVTEQAEPGVASGNSAGHSNSQHASEPATATGAPTELAEPDLPGNGAGNGTAKHASNSDAAKATTAVEMTEPGVVPGHSNSGQPSDSASASAMAAAEPIETSVAPGNSAGHGNSQHASQSATLDASEAGQSAEATFETGGAVQEPAFYFNNLAAPSIPVAAVELEAPNGSPVLLGPDVELAAILEVGPADSNSGQPSHSASASAMAAAEPIETSVAPGNSAGQGNSQHASQHASQSAALNASEAAQPAEAVFETGASQQPAFDFNNLATPSTPVEAVELEVPNGSPVLLGPNVELAAILDVGPAAVEEHAAGHVNNGQHHAKAHLPHDLLI